MQDGRFVQTPYESYRIYHGLGLVAARQARPGEAVAHLRKAIEVYPEGPAAYTTLGGVIVNQGSDYPGAIALLERAIVLNPLNDLARDYLGVAFLNQGNSEKAIQAFRDALAINPGLESAKQHLEVALRATQ
jgi:tetratricopeptide (TPR) repeat protein